MIKYFLVLLAAAAPISELRGAIPLAMAKYHFSPAAAFLLGVAGNLLPIFVLLKYLGPISDWLSERSKIFKKFFHWLFTRTCSKHSKKFEVWGSVALVSFVAVPLPLTGAYTGVAAAFVFCIPPKKALPLISLGVLIAGAVVTLSTMGILNFMKF